MLPLVRAQQRQAPYMQKDCYATLLHAESLPR
jgi:hypothetical protein